jgi:hypothetical protein
MRFVRTVTLALVCFLELTAIARATVTLNPSHGSPGAYVAATGSGWTATHRVRDPRGEHENRLNRLSARVCGRGELEVVS